MIYIFSYRRSIEDTVAADTFFYGCPLSLIPGSRFGGTVEISGSVVSQASYRIMNITFDTDTIADFVDNEEVCTCTDDEMNCDCDFIALHYCFRSDIHNVFLHLKDLFPQSLPVKIVVKAGRYHTSFTTQSNHTYNCYCDNFRNDIELVFNSFDPFDVFVEKTDL